MLCCSYLVVLLIGVDVAAAIAIEVVTIGDGVGARIPRQQAPVMPVVLLLMEREGGRE